MIQSKHFLILHLSSTFVIGIDSYLCEATSSFKLGTMVSWISDPAMIFFELGISYILPKPSLKIRAASAIILDLAWHI